VFGKVVQGMEIADQISVVPTGAKGPFKENAPLKPVIIEKIEHVPAPGG
jgi:peptidyl-prolyl cis-trans isomerase A (cyclophilin A)